MEMRSSNANSANLLQNTYPEFDPNCNPGQTICVSTKGLCPIRTPLRVSDGTECYFSITEQTSVKLEGKVTKYATKIFFKDGNITSYTYIKTGETGNGSQWYGLT